MYQAHDASNFLNESPSAIDPREAANQRIANYGLVDYVLRQRAVADHAVSTLLDLLGEMFPAARAPARSLSRDQP